MRSSSSISGLANSLRALSVNPATRPTTATATTTVVHTHAQTQIRSLSTVLTPRYGSFVIPTRNMFAGSAAVSAVVQQTRGMKVHSSIKKRCEHCKVSRIGEPPPWGRGTAYAYAFQEVLGQSLTIVRLIQIVRRKKSKRGNGYRYVICSANPRHKQRQGA